MKYFKIYSKVREEAVGIISMIFFSPCLSMKQLFNFTHNKNETKEFTGCQKQSCAVHSSFSKARFSQPVKKTIPFTLNLVHFLYVRWMAQ